MIPVTYMHPPARHSSRLGQRFQVALGAAAALAAISLSPGSAQAYVVTVGGVQYDVTTFTGGYNQDTSNFQTAANGGVMPWWGNANLAQEFAGAVGDQLGYPNYFGFQGPWFATNISPNPGYSDNVSGYTIDDGILVGVLGDGNFSVTFNYGVFAQATLYAPPAASVPGPLPLFGAAAAFGFSRKLRKRIKLAPAALGSALPQA